MVWSMLNGWELWGCRKHIYNQLQNRMIKSESSKMIWDSNMKNDFINGFSNEKLSILLGFYYRILSIIKHFKFMRNIKIKF